MNDLFTGLYMQEADSVTARQAKARVSALAVARETVIPFVKQGKSQEQRELRLDIAENDLQELVKKAAAQFDVPEGDIYQEVFQKIAAEVAVTKPKTVDPEKAIGGAEGKKFQDTKDLGDGAPDATTDIVDPDPMKNDEAVAAVVEEPKRHKLVHDDKLETQKVNEHSKPSGKSVDFHSSSAKTAMALSRKDFNMIADILSRNGASPQMIQEFSDWCATENERFDPQRFDDAATPLDRRGGSFLDKTAAPEDVAGFAGAISDDPHGVAEILEGVIAELQSHPKSTPGLLERVQSLHDRIKPEMSREELGKRREVWQGQIGGPEGWTPMGPKAIGRRPGGPRGGKLAAHPLGPTVAAFTYFLQTRFDANQPVDEDVLEQFLDEYQQDPQSFEDR